MNIYAQRLLNVARALRESPDPGKFTMARVMHPCGTPACAFGHYVARADLQNFIKLEMSVLPNGEPFPAYTDNRVANYAAFFDKEVNEHFGITEDENEELFNGRFGCGSARTALEAATYIEAFVARKYPAERKPMVLPNWSAIAAQRTVLPDAVSEDVRA